MPPFIRARRRAALSASAALAALLACAGRETGVELRAGRAARPLADLAVAERGALAIGVVTTDIGRGLAFVVDPAGYMITNRHVIEDADHIEAVIFVGSRPERTFSSVRIEYIDPRRDLALIKVDADAPLPALTLAAAKPTAISGYLRPEDPVLLFARPEDEAPGGGAGAEGLVARTGHVRDLAVYNPAVGPGAFFGLSQAVRRGQSGGPVLDRYGRVVGVVSWTWKHRVGGYAIPIAEAAEMLAERPSMATPADQAARAEARARRFLEAIQTGQLEVARRMMSPAYSRKIRQRTMSTIAEQVVGEGREAIRQFVAALDELVEDAAPGADAPPFSRVHDVVLRTGTSRFMEAIGVAGTLSKEQVLSFFFEFAQTYVSERYFGESDAEGAMHAAMQRLQTVDAARTFAFAEATSRLGDEDQIELARVELVPGAYAPQAVVTLREPASAGGRSVALQLRLEWGDWYVAEIQSIGAPS